MEKDLEQEELEELEGEDKIMFWQQFMKWIFFML